MTNVMTTKLSSKGQVVLPEALRNMYGWDAGTAFTVVVYKGAIINRSGRLPKQSWPRNLTKHSLSLVTRRAQRA